jgi:hypothetical protein
LTETARPERSGLPQPGLLPDQVQTAFGPTVSTHQNLNDGTLEGMACLDIPAFSVQYHPEAAPGPHDAIGLFDDFLELMGLGGEGGTSKAPNSKSNGSNTNGGNPTGPNAVPGAG